MLFFPNTLLKFGPMIANGKVVKLFGRLSLTEEKDSKIICEQVTPIEEMENGSGNNHTPSSKKKRPGLYLKIPNQTCHEYQKAMQYIAIFDGLSPLYLYFTDSSKLVMAPAQYRVSVNDVLIGELQNLLGEKNVAYVE